MQISDGFDLSIDDHVATLRINRPGKRNAMSVAMWRALPGLLAPLAGDPGVRVLVLTGAGGTFCSGADISEVAGLSAEGDDTGLTVAAERALAGFPKPVIAMIEGFCVGGGCQLALACDLRLAAEDARFGITPARLGIVYPLSSTRRLVDVVGPSTAKLLLYSAELVDAGRALRTGLVDEVLPREGLRERVYGLARTMAGNSQLTLAATKEVVDGRADEARFREWQKKSREEVPEGVAAFLERRPPRFTWSS
ncbi:enoyl-CoA hydratase/isomerase family protein [Streptosporangium sp. NPDC000396]|uniref:enoyl-CoA hydratase/isomerase family protein n=1 Tax=Streptosporangium sp. NPDC000396 TaxID=3366185 RepID=UPI0036A832BC